MESIPAELAVEGADLSGWNLRVTGTSDGVLNVWEAGRWWTGNFVLPLADAFQAPELK